MIIYIPQALFVVVCFTHIVFVLQAQDARKRLIFFFYITVIINLLVLVYICKTTLITKDFLNSVKYFQEVRSL